CLVEAARVIVDADDDRPFPRHDLGSRTADPVGKRGDDRDLVGEPHPFPFTSALANALSPSRRTRARACRVAHLRCAQTTTGERTMQLGIHLPHAGSQATPALIKRHAQRAEALGLSDVWVSEHIIVPRAQFPRSPLFY